MTTATPTTAGAIGDAFAAARAAGRTAVVPYVMTGVPDLQATVELVVALADAGADVVELGVPFSDPLADGPTIQRAGAAALASGVTVEDCIDVVARIRAAGCSVPIVLMGYANPLLKRGESELARRLVDAGVNGVIVADLPMEEAGPLSEALDDVAVDLVQLAAPTTGPARLRELGRATRGFLYCVTVTGITGARRELPEALPAFLDDARAAAGDVPIAAGFGIATSAQVALLAPHVDGVVVGSALIDALDGAPREELAQRAAAFVRALRS